MFLKWAGEVKFQIQKLKQKLPVREIFCALELMASAHVDGGGLQALLMVAFARSNGSLDSPQFCRSSQLHSNLPNKKGEATPWHEAIVLRGRDRYRLVVSNCRPNPHIVAACVFFLVFLFLKDMRIDAAHKHTHF